MIDWNLSISTGKCSGTVGTQFFSLSWGFCLCSKHCLLLVYFLQGRHEFFTWGFKALRPWLRVRKGSSKVSQRTMNLFVETEFACGELRLRKWESRGSGAEHAQHRNSFFWKKKINPASNGAGLFEKYVVWGVADAKALSRCAGSCPEGTQLSWLWKNYPA